MSPKRVSVIFVLLALASWASLAQATDRLVPGAYSQIQLAIDAATAGQDNVLITEAGDHPYLPFVLNKAVPVIKTASEEVVVDTLGSTWAAQITDAGGSITGLTLRTGSLGAVSVGSGAILDCTIEDDGDSFSTAAVTVGQGGRVESCQVVLTSGEGRAVQVTASTASDSTEVNDNTVSLYLTSGGSYKEGIYVAGEGAVVNRNRITVAGPDSLNGVGIAIPDASGAESKIRDNLVETAGKGVYVNTPNDGGVEVLRNQILNCYRGVYLSAGSGQTVDRNTILRDECEAWTDGIHIGSGFGSAASSFQNNLLIDLRYGIYVAGTPSVNWTVLHNAYARSDEDCGDKSNETYSIYAIREIEYPLFCEEREGTKAYTHRIDSSAAPGNNGFNEIVGVYGVECAWGTLSRNSALHSGDAATVLEDLTVPAGKSLTLGQGTALRFDEDDDGASGRSSSKNELVVEGTLAASSYFGETEFQSANPSPAAGDWYGIVVKPGGTVDFDEVTVEHAQYGIRDDQGAATATLDLEAVDFAACQTAAVYLYPTPPSDGTGRLTMTDCNVSMGAAPYGVYLLNTTVYDGYDVTIDGGSIAGTSSGTYGLYLRMLGPNGDAEVTDLEVGGLTSGTGIYLAAESPTLECPTVDDCSWGIQLDGTGDPVVRWSTGGGAGLITDCTTGLYAKGSCTVDVDSLAVEDCATGVYTDSYSDGTYTDLDVSGGTTGFRAKSSSAHMFREGNITGFGSFGVDSYHTSGADFGTSGDYGYNNIYSTAQGVSKFFRVKPLISGLDDIPAQGNYWGSATPDTSMFSAAVDYSNYLTSLISLSLPGVGLGESPRPAMLSALPNPSRTRTVIRFVLPEAGGAYTLEVYDVRGRLVREWSNAGEGGRRIEVAWDGADGNGSRVPAGIYFIRLRSGRDTMTQRLVRLGW